MVLLRRVCVTLPLLLFLLAFAPAPFPRSERRTPPVNDLVGKWAYQSSGAISFVITQHRMTYNAEYDYAIKVNSRASPKTYDLVGVGRANQGWEYRGIYKIEGDVLTHTYNPGTKRPMAFDGPGRGEAVEVYKRKP